MDISFKDAVLPLALSLLGVLIGSYLSAVLKIYKIMPPRLLYWLTGICIYSAIVAFTVMPFDIFTAAYYTVIMLGGQEAYDKFLRSVWRGANRWQRDKK